MKNSLKLITAISLSWICFYSYAVNYYQDTRERLN